MDPLYRYLVNTNPYQVSSTIRPVSMDQGMNNNFAFQTPSLQVPAPAPAPPQVSQKQVPYHHQLLQYSAAPQFQTPQPLQLQAPHLQTTQPVQPVQVQHIGPTQQHPQPIQARPIGQEQQQPVQSQFIPPATQVVQQVTTTPLPVQEIDKKFPVMTPVTNRVYSKDEIITPIKQVGRTAVSSESCQVNNAPERHILAAIVESDTVEASPLKSPPVRSSSHLNILANPITTQSGQSSGQFERRLDSLEKNMTQLITIFTSNMSTLKVQKTPEKANPTKTKEDSVKQEQSKEVPLFEDDVPESPAKNILNSQINEIISQDHLFEDKPNFTNSDQKPTMQENYPVESYEDFTAEVPLNSTVHNPSENRKHEKKRRVGRPRKRACEY